MKVVTLTNRTKARQHISDLTPPHAQKVAVQTIVRVNQPTFSVTKSFTHDEHKRRSLTTSVPGTLDLLENPNLGGSSAQNLWSKTNSVSVLSNCLKQVVPAIHDKPLGFLLPIDRASVHAHIQGRFIHATGIQVIPDP